MLQRAAIIDLGTNTFHQIVVEWEGRQFKILDRLQVPVKLGSKAFIEGKIQQDAYERGLKAARDFRDIIDKFQIENIQIYGTATLRIASNAAAFQEEFESILKAPVQIIDGDDEAQLIYNGVRHAVPLGEEPHLIMDIGGGSVEFIIADETQMFWKQSFLIGVSRLNQLFPHADPMETDLKGAIEAFLESELEPLWENADRYFIRTLVGASGTFESISDIDMEMFHSQPQTFPFVHHLMNLSSYREIRDKLLNSTREELSVMPGLIAFRVEMISIGILMIDFIMRRLHIKKLIVSDYAMKEGIMFTLMEKEKQTHS